MTEPGSLHGAERKAILAHREVAPLLSDEHFSVDGTLIKAWASMKSFQPKPEGSPPDDGGPGEPPAPDTAPETQPAKTGTETDPMPRPTRPSRNAEVDFKGETRSNATHVSATDPEARLYKKSPGTGAMLCFRGIMRKLGNDCLHRQGAFHFFRQRHRTFRKHEGFHRNSSMLQ